MSKQHENPSDLLESVSLDELASVSGGRMIPRQGTDPMMIQGIQQLVKTISEASALMNQESEKRKAQETQMLQQLMQMRGGGGR